MSADKELLELAAKAAELTFIDPTLLVDGKFMVRHVSDGKNDRWNPLTDDGDALRLAVKLKIKVHVWGDETNGGIRVNDIIQWNLGDDPYAVTRRAIVRAAAEIGKKP